MRYFKLGQDRRIPNAVLLSNLNSIEGYYEYKRGNVKLLDDSFVSVVNPGQVVCYPDILDRQIFMIKGPVKEVFDIFVPELEYKHCCFLDRTKRAYEQYYVPMLDAMGFKAGIGSGRFVFRNDDSSDFEVVASLEVIEALLRRRPAGCWMVHAHSA